MTRISDDDVDAEENGDNDFPKVDADPDREEFPNEEGEWFV